jgi:hypothetical protein
MVHIVPQVKQFVQDAKEAMHAQTLDLLRKYSALQLQAFFHIKGILTASNAQLERNVLS